MRHAKLAEIDCPASSSGRHYQLRCLALEVHDKGVFYWSSPRLVHSGRREPILWQQSPAGLSVFVHSLGHVLETVKGTHDISLRRTICFPLAHNVRQLLPKASGCRDAHQARSLIRSLWPHRPALDPPTDATQVGLALRATACS